MTNKIRLYQTVNESDQHVYYIVIGNKVYDFKKKLPTLKSLLNEYIKGIDKKTQELLTKKLLENRWKDVVTTYTVDWDYLEVKTLEETGQDVLNLFNFKRTTYRFNKIRKNGEFCELKRYLTKMFKNESGYNAVCNFLSYRLKNPLDLIKLSFVFKGASQTGKSFFTEGLLGKMFGEDNVINLKINKIEDVKFNKILTGNLFTSIDDFESMDRPMLNWAKDFISNAKHIRELKGVDGNKIPNINTLIITTESEPAVLLKDKQHERFVYLDLGDHKIIKDKEQADKILEEVPYFLEYLDSLSPNIPRLSDFDKCNCMEENKIDESQDIEEAINLLVHSKDAKLEEKNGKIGITSHQLNRIFSYYQDITGNSTLIKSDSPFKSFRKLKERYHGKLYKIIDKRLTGTNCRCYLEIKENNNETK